MKESLFRFISGERLMERWGVDIVELGQLPIQPYGEKDEPQRRDDNGNIVEVELEKKTIEDFLVNGYKESVFKLIRFKLSDVEKFERDNPEVSYRPLTGDDKRELGVLRKGKERQDKTVEISFCLGWKIKQGDDFQWKLTRSLIKKFIDKNFPDFADDKTMIENLWQSIPQSFKNDGSGSPKQPMGDPHI